MFAPCPAFDTWAQNCPARCIYRTSKAISLALKRCGRPFRVLHAPNAFTRLHAFKVGKTFPFLTTFPVIRQTNATLFVGTWLLHVLNKDMSTPKLFAVVRHVLRSENTVFDSVTP